MHAGEQYEDDFFAWTRSQAREVRRFARSRPNLPLDLEHIAEEIADLGTSRRDGEADPSARLPERCPYTLDQVLGDFWPPPSNDDAA
jgi:hypothetical protein